MGLLDSIHQEDRRTVLAAMTALETSEVMKLDYNGKTRFVEVHAVGYSKAGNPVARVYQLHGGSDSNENEGWKLLDLSKVPQTFSMTGQKSQAPRTGYKMGDAGMLDIFKEFQL